MDTGKHETAADSIPTFAKIHGICPATVYNLIRRGKGPKLMRVGRRTLVSKEAAAEWRGRMEDQSHSEAA